MKWDRLLIDLASGWLRPSSRDKTHTLLKSPESQRFSKYCNAEYAAQEQTSGYTIEKVIVIHRHGDRTPVTMVNSKWADESCMRCEYGGESQSINSCEESACKGGELTLKGFKQLERLGEFIKKTYSTLLPNKDIEDIDLRATSYGRTQASLFGVVNGIQNTDSLKNVRVPENDSLLNPTNCDRLQEMVKVHGQDFFSTMRSNKRKLTPEKMADNYWTHLCNDVSVNCDVLDCEEKNIWKYLDASSIAWAEQARVAYENESVIKMVFGRFAKELGALVQSDTRMHIYSAHDNSLSSLLIGLGTKILARPPYASAIFIERWADASGKKFVRVIYNNETCKTLIDKQTNIPLEKFTKYIKLLEADNEELEKLCTMYP